MSDDQATMVTDKAIGIVPLALQLAPQDASEIMRMSIDELKHRFSAIVQTWPSTSCPVHIGTAVVNYLVVKSLTEEVVRDADKYNSGIVLQMRTHLANTSELAAKFIRDNVGLQVPAEYIDTGVRVVKKLAELYATNHSCGIGVDVDMKAFVEPYRKFLARPGITMEMFLGEENVPVMFVEGTMKVYDWATDSWRWERVRDAC